MSKLLLFCSLSCSLFAMNKEICLTEPETAVTKIAKPVMMCDQRTSLQVGRYNTFIGSIRNAIFARVGADCSGGTCSFGTPDRLKGALRYVFEEVHPELYEEFKQHIDENYRERDPSSRLAVCQYLVRRTYNQSTIDHTTGLLLALITRDKDLIITALDNGANCTSQAVQDVVKKSLEALFVYELAPVLIERDLLVACTKDLGPDMNFGVQTVPSLWRTIYNTIKNQRNEGSNELRQQLVNYLFDHDFALENQLSEALRCRDFAMLQLLFAKGAKIHKLGINSKTVIQDIMDNNKDYGFEALGQLLNLLDCIFVQWHLHPEQCEVALELAKESPAHEELVQVVNQFSKEELQKAIKESYKNNDPYGYLAQSINRSELVKLLTDEKLRRLRKLLQCTGYRKKTPLECLQKPWFDSSKEGQEKKQRYDRVKQVLGESFEEIYREPIESHLRALIGD